LTFWGEGIASHRVMTTANQITIARILLVPFFVVQVVYYLTEGHEVHRLLAILAFAIAAISDGVDGYVAKHYNQRSELGAILDPLADKLLLVSAVVLLSFHNQQHLTPLPMWLTSIILSRDALLLLGLGVIHFVCGKARVRPHLTGKVATVLQMGAVLWTLFKWDIRWLPAWSIGAALFTGISGLFYVLDGVRQLSASPASSPTPAPAQAKDQASEDVQNGRFPQEPR
jgi:cardiolipin synthase (CMP-forming)